MKKIITLPPSATDKRKEKILSALPPEMREGVEQLIEIEAQKKAESMVAEVLPIQAGLIHVVDTIGIVHTLAAGFDNNPPKLAAMLEIHRKALGEEWITLYPRLEEYYPLFLPTLRQMVTDCSRGLHFAIDHKDGGQYLLDHVDPRKIAQLRSSIDNHKLEHKKRPGAPKKQSWDNNYIARRLLEFRPSLEFSIDRKELLAAMRLLANDILGAIDSTPEEIKMAGDIENRLKKKPYGAIDWARKIIDSYLEHRLIYAENYEYLSISE